MLAKARQAQPSNSRENFIDNDTKSADANVSITRDGYGHATVYKLTPTGCVRIAIAVQSIGSVLSTPGYAPECFDCGRDDCLYVTQVRGEVSTNECEAKAARPYRACPVRSCRKPIYDSAPTGKFLSDEFDHSGRVIEGAIDDDEYNTSTPASRTKAAMDLHLIGFHPQEAMEMGIQKPRELPRMELVN